MGNMETLTMKVDLLNKNFNLGHNFEPEYRAFILYIIKVSPGFNFS